jgi:hypothetical protein
VHLCISEGEEGFMLVGIPWSRSPGERFGDGDWVMATLRPESFVRGRLKILFE